MNELNRGSSSNLTISHQLNPNQLEQDQICKLLTDILTSMSIRNDSYKKDINDIIFAIQIAVHENKLTQDVINAKLVVLKNLVSDDTTCCIDFLKCCVYLAQKQYFVVNKSADKDFVVELKEKCEKLDKSINAYDRKSLDNLLSQENKLAFPSTFFGSSSSSSAADLGSASLKPSVTFRCRITNSRDTLTVLFKENSIAKAAYGKHAEKINILTRNQEIYMLIRDLERNLNQMGDDDKNISLSGDATITITDKTKSIRESENQFTISKSNLSLIKSLIETQLKNYARFECFSFLDENMRNSISTLKEWMKSDDNINLATCDVVIFLGADNLNSETTIDQKKAHNSIIGSVYNHISKDTKNSIHIVNGPSKVRIPSNMDMPFRSKVIEGVISCLRCLNDKQYQKTPINLKLSGINLGGLVAIAVYDILEWWLSYDHKVVDTINSKLWSKILEVMSEDKSEKIDTSALQRNLKGKSINYSLLLLNPRRGMVQLSLNVHKLVAPKDNRRLFVIFINSAREGSDAFNISHITVAPTIPTVVVSEAISLATAEGKDNPRANLLTSTIIYKFFGMRSMTDVQLGNMYKNDRETIPLQLKVDSTFKRYLVHHNYGDKSKYNKKLLSEFFSVDVGVDNLQRQSMSLPNSSMSHHTQVSSTISMFSMKNISSSSTLTSGVRASSGLSSSSQLLNHHNAELPEITQLSPTLKILCTYTLNIATAAHGEHMKNEHVPYAIRVQQLKGLIEYLNKSIKSIKNSFTETLKVGNTKLTITVAQNSEAHKTYFSIAHPTETFNAIFALDRSDVNACLDVQINNLNQYACFSLLNENMQIGLNNLISQNLTQRWHHGSCFTTFFLGVDQTLEKAKKNNVLGPILKDYELKQYNNRLCAKIFNGVEKGWMSGNIEENQFNELVLSGVVLCLQYLIENSKKPEINVKLSGFDFGGIVAIAVYNLILWILSENFSTIDAMPVEKNDRYAAALKRFKHNLIQNIDRQNFNLNEFVKLFAKKAINFNILLFNPCNSIAIDPALSIPNLSAPHNKQSSTSVLLFAPTKDTGDISHITVNSRINAVVVSEHYNRLTPILLYNFFGCNISVDKVRNISIDLPDSSIGINESTFKRGNFKQTYGEGTLYFNQLVSCIHTMQNLPDVMGELHIHYLNLISYNSAAAKYDIEYVRNYLDQNNKELLKTFNFLLDLESTSSKNFYLANFAGSIPRMILAGIASGFVGLPNNDSLKTICCRSLTEILIDEQKAFQDNTIADFQSNKDNPSKLRMLLQHISFIRSPKTLVTIGAGKYDLLTIDQYSTYFINMVFGLLGVKQIFDSNDDNSLNTLKDYKYGSFAAEKLSSELLTPNYGMQKICDFSDGILTIQSGISESPNVEHLLALVQVYINLQRTDTPENSKQLQQLYIRFPRDFIQLIAKKKTDQSVKQERYNKRKARLGKTLIKLREVSTNKIYQPEDANLNAADRSSKLRLMHHIDTTEKNLAAINNEIKLLESTTYLTQLIKDEPIFREYIYTAYCYRKKSEIKDLQRDLVNFINKLPLPDAALYSAFKVSTNQVSAVMSDWMHLHNIDRVLYANDGMCSFLNEDKTFNQQQLSQQIFINLGKKEIKKDSDDNTVKTLSATTLLLSNNNFEEGAEGGLRLSSAVPNIIWEYSEDELIQYKDIRFPNGKLKQDYLLIPKTSDGVNKKFLLETHYYDKKTMTWEKIEDPQNYTGILYVERNPALEYKNEIAMRTYISSLLSDVKLELPKVCSFQYIIPGHQNYARVGTVGSKVLEWVSTAPQQMRVGTAVNLCFELLDILVLLYKHKITHGDLHLLNMKIVKNALRLFDWGEGARYGKNFESLTDILYILGGGTFTRRTTTLLSEMGATLSDVLASKAGKHRPLEKILEAADLPKNSINQFMDKYVKPALELIITVHELENMDHTILAQLVFNVLEQVKQDLLNFFIPTENKRLSDIVLQGQGKIERSMQLEFKKDSGGKYKGCTQLINDKSDGIGIIYFKGNYNPLKVRQHEQQISDYIESIEQGVLKKSDKNLIELVDNVILLSNMVNLLRPISQSTYTKFLVPNLAKIIQFNMKNSYFREISQNIDDNYNGELGPATRKLTALLMEFSLTDSKGRKYVILQDYIKDLRSRSKSFSFQARQTIANKLLNKFIQFLQTLHINKLSHRDPHAENLKISYGKEQKNFLKDKGGDVLEDLPIDDIQFAGIDWDGATFGGNYDNRVTLQYVLGQGSVLKQFQQATDNDEECCRRMVLAGILSIIYGDAKKAYEHFMSHDFANLRNNYLQKFKDLNLKVGKDSYLNDCNIFFGNLVTEIRRSIKNISEKHVVPFVGRTTITPSITSSNTMGQQSGQYPSELLSEEKDDDTTKINTGKEELHASSDSQPLNQGVQNNISLQASTLEQCKQVLYSQEQLFPKSPYVDKFIRSFARAIIADPVKNEKYGTLFSNIVDKKIDISSANLKALCQDFFARFQMNSCDLVVKNMVLNLLGVFASNPAEYSNLWQIIFNYITTHDDIAAINYLFNNLRGLGDTNQIWAQYNKSINLNLEPPSLFDVVLDREIYNQKQLDIGSLIQSVNTACNKNNKTSAGHIPNTYKEQFNKDYARAKLKNGSDYFFKLDGKNIRLVDIVDEHMQVNPVYEDKLNFDMSSKIIYLLCVQHIYGTLTVALGDVLGKLEDKQIRIRDAESYQIVFQFVESKDGSILIEGLYCYEAIGVGKTNSLTIKCNLFFNSETLGTLVADSTDIVCEKYEVTEFKITITPRFKNDLFGEEFILNKESAVNPVVKSQSNYPWNFVNVASLFAEILLIKGENITTQTPGTLNSWMGSIKSLTQLIVGDTVKSGENIGKKPGRILINLALSSIHDDFIDKPFITFIKRFATKYASYDKLTKQQQEMIKAMIKLISSVLFAQDFSYIFNTYLANSTNLILRRLTINIIPIVFTNNENLPLIILNNQGEVSTINNLIESDKNIDRISGFQKAFALAHNSLVLPVTQTNIWDACTGQKPIMTQQTITEFCKLANEQAKFNWKSSATKPNLPSHPSLFEQNYTGSYANLMHYRLANRLVAIRGIVDPNMYVNDSADFTLVQKRILPLLICERYFMFIINSVEHAATDSQLNIKMPDIKYVKRIVVSFVDEAKSSNTTLVKGQIIYESRGENINQQVTVEYALRFANQLLLNQGIYDGNTPLCFEVSIDRVVVGVVEKVRGMFQSLLQNDKTTIFTGKSGSQQSLEVTKTLGKSSTSSGVLLPKVYVSYSGQQYIAVDNTVFDGDCGLQAMKAALGIDGSLNQLRAAMVNVNIAFFKLENAPSIQQIQDAYNTIFGSIDHFKAFMAYNIESELRADDLKPETQLNLLNLKNRIQSLELFNFDLELYQEIQKRTLGVNVQNMYENIILGAYQAGMDVQNCSNDILDTYSALASLDKVWLGNNDIIGYMLSCGYRFVGTDVGDSPDKSANITVLKFQSLDKPDEWVYIANDTMPTHNADGGSHFMCVTPVLFGGTDNSTSRPRKMSKSISYPDAFFTQLRIAINGGNVPINQPELSTLIHTSKPDELVQHEKFSEICRQIFNLYFMNSYNLTLRSMALNLLGMFVSDSDKFLNVWINICQEINNKDKLMSIDFLFNNLYGLNDNNAVWKDYIELKQDLLNRYTSSQSAGTQPPMFDVMWDNYIYNQPSKINGLISLTNTKIGDMKKDSTQSFFVQLMKDYERLKTAEYYFVLNRDKIRLYDLVYIDISINLEDQSKFSQDDIDNAKFQFIKNYDRLKDNKLDFTLTSGEKIKLDGLFNVSVSINPHYQHLHVSKEMGNLVQLLCTQAIFATPTKYFVDAVDELNMFAGDIILSEIVFSLDSTRQTGDIILINGAYNYCPRIGIALTQSMNMICQFEFNLGKLHDLTLDSKEIVCTNYTVTELKIKITPSVPSLSKNQFVFESTQLSSETSSSLSEQQPSDLEIQVPVDDKIKKLWNSLELAVLFKEILTGKGDVKKQIGTLEFMTKLIDKDDKISGILDKERRRVIISLALVCVDREFDDNPLISFIITLAERYKDVTSLTADQKELFDLVISLIKPVLIPNDFPMVYAAFFHDNKNVVLTALIEYMYKKFETKLSFNNIVDELKNYVDTYFEEINKDLEKRQIRNTHTEVFRGDYDRSLGVYVECNKTQVLIKDLLNKDMTINEETLANLKLKEKFELGIDEKLILPLLLTQTYRNLMSGELKTQALLLGCDLQLNTKFAIDVYEIKGNKVYGSIKYRNIDSDYKFDYSYTMEINLERLRELYNKDLSYNFKDLCIKKITFNNLSIINPPRKQK